MGGEGRGQGGAVQEGGHLDTPGRHRDHGDWGRGRDGGGIYAELSATSRVIRHQSDDISLFGALISDEIRERPIHSTKYISSKITRLVVLFHT